MCQIPLRPTFYMEKKNLSQNEYHIYQQILMINSKNKFVTSES